MLCSTEIYVYVLFFYNISLPSKMPQPESLRPLVTPSSRNALHRSRGLFLMAHNTLSTDVFIIFVISRTNISIFRNAERWWIDRCGVLLWHGAQIHTNMKVPWTYPKSRRCCQATLRHRRGQFLSRSHTRSAPAATESPSRRKDRLRWPVPGGLLFAGFAAVGETDLTR